MQTLIQKSKLKDLRYTPYTFTPNCHFQAIFCCIFELLFNFYYPVKYEREMFVLSDGGTIAYDWVRDHEGGFPLKNS